MPTTTNRIAQTSTEAKRQYKKNGPGIPERQLRQLERANELDQRAARLREAEKRRAVAKKKREEKEEQQRLLRQQQGIGAATQAIGYNHTQARTKNWMESFLGVDKKKAEAKRQREDELVKKLEEITNDLENEPWDDDEVEDEGDHVALNLSTVNGSAGEKWADDDLDDDSLLEVHDQIMSDPINDPPSSPRAAPFVRPVRPPALPQSAVHDDAAFIREHGFVNRIVEDILDKLPEPLVELLSHDVSMRLPEWEPPSALLHKLNPAGLPPHRLRIKVGCVVTVLRDLNTSSQLSKSQHLQILRIENDRIECLVLDGQLEGTKIFLTRVPFMARYKNLDHHPFQRTQFPIRVVVDYPTPPQARKKSSREFKVPSIPGRSATHSSRAQPSLDEVKMDTNKSIGFKLPGLPASKSTPAPCIPSTISDGWDDFLESGTQIARELSADTHQPSLTSSSAPVVPSLCMLDVLPPLSTQDLNFSLDDLEEDSSLALQEPRPAPCKISVAPPSIAPRIELVEETVRQPESHAATKMKIGDKNSVIISNKGFNAGKRPISRTQPSIVRANPIDLSKLRASQKPPSVSDRPGLKRKAHNPVPTNQPPSKKPYAPSQSSRAPKAIVHAIDATHGAFDDFFMSTQDVAFFFDDDDEFLG